MIISVDADSEKMEPRCQQLEDTTPAPLPDLFSSCQEDNTDREKLPSLLRSNGQFFSGKKRQDKLVCELSATIFKAVESDIRLNGYYQHNKNLVHVLLYLGTGLFTTTLYT